MEQIPVRGAFRIVESLEVPVLVETYFIDKFVKIVSYAKERIVRYN